MKKILCLSAMFLAWTVNAQKNQIKFDNLLQYSYKSANREISDYEKLATNVYYSSAKKASLFEINTYYQPNTFSLVKDGKMLSIASIGLDRVVKIPNTASYTFPTMESMGQLLGGNVSFISMNKKGNFNNTPCDFYTLDTSVLEGDNYTYTSVCFCVDTSNKFKNLKAIFPQANIDGLVLAYGSAEDQSDMVSLDAIKKTDIQIDLDFDAEYAKLETEYKDYLKQFEADETTPVDYDTISAVGYDDYYSDPLCNNYEYFQELEEKTKSFSYQFKDIACSLKNIDTDYDGVPDMQRKEAIVIAKKQAQAAIKQAKKSKALSKSESKSLTAAFEKMFEAADKYIPGETPNYVSDYAYATDAAVDSVSWGENMYTTYQSNYKNNDIQTVSLAAESQYNYGFESNMPSYCTELKTKVPNFKDQELKKHVYNLVGQICDLYLYQNGGDVAYIDTIDSMRKSLLEIENKRADLNKNDAKLLKEYLNSLD